MKTAFSLLFPLIAGFLCAQTTDRLEADLRKMEKETVLIRHFYEGLLLRYDAAGRIVGAPEGTWTVSGYVEIQKVRITDGAMVMEGRRLAAIYDRKQRNMRLARYGEPVVIKVPVANDNDAHEKLKLVFVTTNEDQVALVPGYWKHYAETHEIVDLSKKTTNAPEKDAEPKNGVYRVGGSVSPPKPLRMPEPRFTSFARRFGIQGNTGIQLVVNEKGEPEDLTIVKPLGAGLDEAAVQAVAHGGSSRRTRTASP